MSFILVGLWGCSGERDPSELLGPAQTGTVVVDAVLIVGSLYPEVRVSRTIDPNRPYSPGAAAVSDAAVRITDHSGQSFQSVVIYGERANEPGVYVPDQIPTTPRITPNTTYTLEVITPDGTVSAVTTTPGELSVDEWMLLEDDGVTERRALSTFDDVTLDDELFDLPSNQLVHGDGILEARFARPEVPGFQVGVFSLDFDSDFAVDVSFLSDEDIADIGRDGSSPILLVEDGNLRLPWLAVLFEGRHVIRIYAVDRNWFDLVRSFPELNGDGGGFGGNAGDNFERPIFNIEGGIGLFGSAAVDSVGFFVTAAD